MKEKNTESTKDGMRMKLIFMPEDEVSDKKKEEDEGEFDSEVTGG